MIDQHYFSPPLLSAYVYDDGEAAELELQDLVRRLRSAGRHLAGVVQMRTTVPGRARCDMVLENLADGSEIVISEYRGEESRGCRLDLDALAKAEATVLAGLIANRPDMLILNKFGKMEASGAGLIPLITAAIQAEVPVLIGVPPVNLAAWRAFAGDIATEILSLDDLVLHLDLPEDLVLARAVGF